MTTTSPATLPPPMALALTSNFGSVEHFVEAVVALANDHGDAPGQIRLAFDSHSGALRILWAVDADANGATLIPLLTIAQPIEPGEFFAGIDWLPVYEHYQHAVHAASQRFAAHDIAGALLLDVRRAGVFEAASTMLPGAAWHDPAAVNAWAQQLPSERPVLVYCVYGHEVGRVTAMRLQALGVNARFLVGGIDAWERAGRATVAKH